jgi:hypothetical protein
LLRCIYEIQEQFRDFKYGNWKSKFAKHHIDNKHSIELIEDIMEILYITKQGSMMETQERFHMYTT